MRFPNRKNKTQKPTRVADLAPTPGQLLRVELKEDLQPGSTGADAYVLQWNGSSFRIGSTVVEIFDPFQTASGTKRDAGPPVVNGSRFWVRWSTDVKRFEIITASPGAAIDKMLYLPLQNLTNYMLPQDTSVACFGYEVIPDPLNIYNIDTTTAYVILDCFGSIALPGQKVLCRFNDAIDAWTPYPHGQNALQAARTYKKIPAGGVVNGDDIWFLGFDGTLTNGDLVEVSECINDDVFFTHATSGDDIDASMSAPLEIYLNLFHVGGGAEWHVVGRECNP